MDALDPCSDDDINNDVNSLYIEIIDKNGNIEFEAPFNGKYYEVRLSVAKKQKDKINYENRFDETKNNEINKIKLWHQRLAHISKDYLMMMKNKNMAVGMDFNSKDIFNPCEGCAIGKFKRSPVRKEFRYDSAGEAVILPKEKLDKICIDLVGPIRPASREGFIGFASVTDAATKYRWIVFLKSKAETPRKLIDLFENIQNRNRKNIIAVRSDQGSEFMNHALREYFRKKGISHELSSVYTPEENGVSERSNGLIQGGMNSLFFRIGKIFLVFCSKSFCVLFE